jgi:hypothetical protein
MNEEQLLSFWNLILLNSRKENLTFKNIHGEEYYIPEVNFYENCRGVIHMKSRKNKKDLIIYAYRKNITHVYEIENIPFSFFKNEGNFFTETDISSADYLKKNFDFENILLENNFLKTPSLKK